MNNDNLNLIAQAEVNTHLKEYEILRAEIREYIQRVDRYIGIYLAASFAVVAVFLQPGKNYDVEFYFDGINKNIYLTSFILIIPILNSILQIHLLSFMYAIITIAHYSTYVVGERISKILYTDVLLWDKIYKEPWMTVRTIAGVVYNILLYGLSLSIIVIHSDILFFKKGILLFFLHMSGIIMVVLSLSCAVRYSIIVSKFRDMSTRKFIKVKTIFIIIFLLLILIMFIKNVFRIIIGFLTGVLQILPYP